MRVSMDAVREEDKLCEAAICYTGDILDPARAEIRPQILCRRWPRSWRRPARTSSRVKDMAGLLKPAAARVLFKALREETDLPIHFHTHDTSGLSAATVLAAVDSGVDAIDAAMDALLRQHLAALPRLARRGAARHRARPGLDPECDPPDLVLLGGGAQPVRAPSRATSRGRRSEVYLHEMPGGQFTNLKEQARSLGLETRWHEVAQAYADVNLMFGDIVKVTPSSKVVGDMALMMVSQDLTVADVENPAQGHRLPGFGRVDAARRSRPAARRLAGGAAEEGAEGREADHRAAGLAAHSRRPRGRAQGRSRRKLGRKPSATASSPPS